MVTSSSGVEGDENNDFLILRKCKNFSKDCELGEIEFAILGPMSVKNWFKVSAITWGSEVT